ncbi:DUF3299 domain-containing protein [Teredinibacter turnerae]|uniref:DUF3299 domain-containing protein n=1 Tax=Teredinibacter turnerae TaxID=2426 RepID=UPI00036DC7C3|nr:DUF3299 domain-containing protein [Teredinibacter turnerae]
MARRKFTVWHYAVVLLLALCARPMFAATADKPDSNQQNGYQPVEWVELMPDDDLEALLNPPAYLDNIAEGSEADQIGNQAAEAAAKQSNDRYQQALTSTKVRPEFNQRKISIPGFIVPLAFDENMVITEFFLVPFFGACIHAPPPPPNQMIYIRYPKGLKLENLYDPYVAEGSLIVEGHKSDGMGAASYSMNVDNLSPYTET